LMEKKANELAELERQRSTREPADGMVRSEAMEEKV
jgi:hypothetical protein